MNKLEIELTNFLNSVKKDTLTKREWFSEIGFYWKFNSQTSVRYKFHLLIHHNFLVATANGYTKRAVK